MPQQPLSQVPADATWEWQSKEPVGKQTPSCSSIQNERGSLDYDVTVLQRQCVLVAMFASNVRTTRSDPVSRMACGADSLKKSASASTFASHSPSSRVSGAKAQSLPQKRSPTRFRQPHWESFPNSPTNSRWLSA